MLSRMLRRADLRHVRIRRVHTSMRDGADGILTLDGILGELPTGVLMLNRLCMMRLWACVLSWGWAVLLAGCCGWVVVIFLEGNGLAVVLVLGWDVGVCLCGGGSSDAVFVPG